MLTFRDTKNGSDRTIPITPRTREVLQEMKGWKLGEYVFATTNRDNKPTHLLHLIESGGALTSGRAEQVISPLGESVSV